MNTQRFGWPVIIAASLHGALFLISSEPRVTDIDPPRTKPTEIRIVPEDERITMRPEDGGDPDSAAGGPVTPLPSIPDVPEPLRGDEAFTVPVTPYQPSIVPVKTLDGVIGLPSETGIGIGPVGRPALPGVDKLDRRPRAMVQPAPAYPDDMRRASIDGSVTVEFVVDTEGRVLRAEAVKWTHREFVDPAVRAVLRWRFEPGTQNGRKVSFRMAVPIEFSATE